MPDNVPISPGQGAVIATDQDAVTGAHYQRVKLMDGTENSSDPITSDGKSRLQCAPPTRICSKREPPPSRS